MKILDKYKINYIYQCKFEDCKDIKCLPFDFYLTDYDSCIEFDGQQHFDPIFGEEAFKRTQKHDNYKNEYCKNNNIDLLRIPYWDGNNMENIICDYFSLPKYKLISYPITK